MPSDGAILGGILGVVALVIVLLLVLLPSKSHFTGSSQGKEGFGVYTELARYDNWTYFGFFVAFVAGLCVLGGSVIAINSKMQSLIRGRS
jgi:hypothetical protein